MLEELWKRAAEECRLPPMDEANSDFRDCRRILKESYKNKRNPRRGSNEASTLQVRQQSTREPLPRRSPSPAPAQAPPAAPAAARITRNQLRQALQTAAAPSQSTVPQRRRRQGEDEDEDYNPSNERRNKAPKK